MFYSITNNLIGYRPLYRTTAWYHGRDSLENFKLNLEKQGPEWYYANAKISYERNNLGHREKNLDSINLDNYALCVGCSITEGIALEVDTRYSNLLQKDLGMDMYNMGIGGTGNDVIVYNVLSWLNTIPQKPKFIVIQWTDTTRFISEQADGILKVNGVWDTQNRTDEFIVLGENLKYFSTKSKLLRNLIKSSTDIPVIEIIWQGIEFFFNPKQEDIILPPTRVTDYGRDLLHPGIQAHRKWADLIIEKVKNLPS